ncbi:hypothetical protein FBEOM_4873 [Fusarium beomiforme]|uniref:Uncharacterized protein n=1 Tax=Fusarium beomiforme TaxID=44412 RepID=A0A9P5DZJ0_9HYPO|nr:hypothetical protein FBEOM_4873 [Fusarium beomiforme]
MTRPPRFRDLGAWEALKKRDLEYAINLLVSGEWIIDGVVKDGWSSLDARVGSERCHETALLALILRHLIMDYLRDFNLDQAFKELITEYRVGHADDKRWTHVFTLQDISVENPVGYDRIMSSIIDFMGPDWTLFIGSARTLASFSVLSTMECGLHIYYRRLGDVFVATTKEQQAVGLGEYHDAEFPLRTAFTEVSFKLLDKLSAHILPTGVPAKPFGTEPRVCDTLAEQAREIFHFSKAKKIIPRHNSHYIVVGSFSASMHILIRLCWLYRIPITLCMPRLRYQTTSDGSGVTYKPTSVPVRTYIATEKSGGSFKIVDPKRGSIENEPCWKLGGYSMYHESQLGKLLSSNNDDDYIKALESCDVGHLLSIFGFFHHEYPPQTEINGVDLMTLQNSVCGGVMEPPQLTLESIRSGWGLNPNDKRSNLNLVSLSEACNEMTRQFNLDDTFLARQHNPAARTSYRMQSKPIPFTFNHIEVSTPSLKKAKWAAILLKHESTTEPMFANLFFVGNMFYSMSDQAEADRLMLVNSDNKKISSLLVRHPKHEVFLSERHKAKFDRLRKGNTETCKKKENGRGVQDE